MTKNSDLQLLTKALAFAADKHKGQTRKDSNKTPYINHPIALVNFLVNEDGVTDSEILCAALLHDTIEDTKTRPEEVTEAFGTAISSIVQELTDDKSITDKAERKRLQEVHSPHLSTKARAVKLADKICNLRDVINSPPSHWSLERRQEYFAWSKRVIDGLRGDWQDMEALFDRQYETGLFALTKGG